MKTIEAKIAVRNLLANSRRTFLTLFIIVVGLTSILFIAGYISMVRIGFREVLIEEVYTHFQIYKKGYGSYDDKTSMKYSLTPEEVKNIESILMPREEVDFILPRTNLQGIIGNTQKTKLFLGYGSDPELENNMAYGKMVEGVKLSPTDYSMGVLGTGLAEKLEASLGDQLQITVPNEGGGLEAELITVGGIANFGPKELNDTGMIVSLDIAKSLNYTDRVQKLMVKLHDTDDLEAIYSYFLEEADKAGLDIETKTWVEMDPFYLQVLRDYTFQLNLIATILLFVILLAVSNTIYMSIIERTPEIGTLRAIGISKVEIIRTVLFEGLVLGVLGALIGMALVFLIQFILQKFYIELPPPPTRTEPIQLLIMLRAKDLIFYPGLLAVSSSLATVLPALKASNTNIVSAIRHA